MTTDKDKLIDDLTHARANYWILTFVCSAVLAFFLNELIHGSSLISSIFYSVLLGTGYYFTTVLDNKIKTIKSELYSPY